jgi:NTP pyrophosphatase (non-canonical NTP hydrolase)
VDFSDYQEATKRTDQHPSPRLETLSIPILGLVGEAGSLATAYKKFLRDGLPWEDNRDFIKKELGDILWYISTIATHCSLDLNEIACENVQRTLDRYGCTDRKWCEVFATPALDAEFPDQESFPRKMKFIFSETTREDDEKIASLSLVEASPNIFPDGPISMAGKKDVGFKLGASLSNNALTDDGYRYHDAIHIAFLGILGWSPVMRSLLRIKRKSNPEVDECEDGARAHDVEEGISTFLANKAKSYNFFREPRNVDNDTLDYIEEATKHLEVQKLPRWLWKHAISEGFRAKCELQKHQGGVLEIDLDKRTIQFKFS